MKNMIKIVLKRGFSWPGGNLTEKVRESRKPYGWGFVFSIF